MPDLPPSVYVPAFGALALVITTLTGGLVWCAKGWIAEAKEKDAIQEKWISYQEQKIPVEVQRNTLMERMLALLED